MMYLRLMGLAIFGEELHNDTNKLSFITCHVLVFVACIEPMEIR